jgi:hypothetical protein
LGDTQLVLDLSRRLARAVRHRGRIAQIAEIAAILRTAFQLNQSFV